jgi:hypothetical protein
MLKQIKNMLLQIASTRLIGDIQKEFNAMFPFLKLEFYRVDENNAAPVIKRFLPGKYAVLNARRTRQEGELEVDENMTVGSLEKQFLFSFGLGVQVHRKSGNVWLETTMTDSWTLQKQNEHGREISLSAKKPLMNEPDGEDM